MRNCIKIILPCITELTQGNVRRNNMSINPEIMKNK